MSEAARTASDTDLLVEYDRRVRDLERRLLTIEGDLKRPQAWVFPALVPNWTTYAFNPMRYFKGGDGLVYLAGEATYNAVGSVTPFVLPNAPENYRPAEESRFPIAQVGAGTLWVSIYPSGNVSLDFGPAVGSRYRIDCAPFRTI